MKIGRLALFVFMLSVGLCSCENKTRVKRPDPCLSEHQMIEVLSDVYLVEAILNQKKAQGQPFDSLTNSYYEQLFEHYGITDSIFEQNLKYYTYHPDVLERVMDSVTSRFAKAQQ